jgi:putative radical SAM enzyme (TIGR03279 family)
MQRVLAVENGGLAARHGIIPGDVIESINGEPLIDDIDYQALTSARHLHLRIRKADGRYSEVDIIKSTSSPLGLTFEQLGSPDILLCGNNCIFCFVDQMPDGMRDTLYVKDDDWRMSLRMGNFITLTNVGEREFDRILRRKVSPLYISVHATNPAVRISMLRNRRAGHLMECLHKLKDAGLCYHCQIVLCPGINDGAVLEQTLQDLLSLAPNVLSVALVPVGLTRFREGLDTLASYHQQSAREVLEICHSYQEKALARFGKRLIYPADEFICIAQSPLPDGLYYEGYPQLENGIGMIRLMEDELEAAAVAGGREDERKNVPVRLVIACGTSIQPYLSTWAETYKRSHVHATVVPIRNRFFGESVTVSGLVVGQDLAEQLTGIPMDLLMLPDTMLNREGTLFLDDFSVEQLQDALGVPIAVVPVDGYELYKALQDPHGLLNEQKGMKNGDSI